MEEETLTEEAQTLLKLSQGRNSFGYWRQVDDVEFGNDFWAVCFALTQEQIDIVSSGKYREEPNTGLRYFMCLQYVGQKRYCYNCRRTI